MISKRTKIICSFLGCLFFILGISVFGAITSFNVYFVSYIYHYDQSIKITNVLFSGAVFTLTSTSFGFIGGRLDSKFGCHM